MKLFKKIKDWRDRRFQKRVLNALGAEIINGKDGAIIFDRDVQTLDNIPVIDTDEIHGVPV